jgi:hypothetical protein
MIGHAQVRTTEHHELVLPASALVAELEDAIRVIKAAQAEAQSRFGVSNTPLVYRVDGDSLVLSYERVQATTVPLPPQYTLGKEFLADE